MQKRLVTDWQKMLELWAASTQTKREFCRTQQISYPMFSKKSVRAPKNLDFICLTKPHQTTESSLQEARHQAASRKEPIFAAPSRKEPIFAANSRQDPPSYQDFIMRIRVGVVQIKISPEASISYVCAIIKTLASGG